MLNSESIFDAIVSVQVPASVVAREDGKNPSFEVEYTGNGPIPLAQVVVWFDGGQHVVAATGCNDKPNTYVVTIPEGLTLATRLTLQIEGCRRADIHSAQAADWIKRFVDVEIRRPVARRPSVRGGTPAARIFFGIHKHMHQPYYRAADPGFWDGEIDGIFGTRRGAYVDFLVDAIDRYVAGQLPHAGLSASFSGTLVEQLDRCAAEGRCGGQFENWSRRLRQTREMRTSLGNPRLDFSAFGLCHPLFPLIPQRDIVRSIRSHRELLRASLGVDASPILFPPETAFHVRIIPALLEAGVTAVVYDSIHRFRACRAYPYAGKNEGMLPPNRAEQTNGEVNDWMQLQNIWAASPISPTLLRPTFIGYEDAEGHEYRIVGVPAERYLGNEDARGGFGALQYPSVMGQIYDKIVAEQLYDPRHPPFFLLHSDGDNYGGGADSYYRHNTEMLVDWLKQDARFELTTIRDYLDRFPPDPSDTVHVEPGSWSGADNGDPQFAKWFGRVEQDYSPDVNSWAVLTMLQNVVHSLEDIDPSSSRLVAAIRLLQTAETSCYWYWTGQDIWDAQVTEAANHAYALLTEDISRIQGRDQTGPTIFPPWVIPANPGGQHWSQHGLGDAPRTGVLYTLVADVSQVRGVEVVLRHTGGELTLPLVDCGAYPSRTGAVRSAHLYRIELPEGLGDVRYYLRAVDGLRNVSHGSLERIYLA